MFIKDPRLLDFRTTFYEYFLYYELDYCAETSACELFDIFYRFPLFITLVMSWESRIVFENNVSDVC
jgi:hypothetical protein